MGIFGVIGKMAGSKIVDKVEDELTKKQNREQTSGYCKYIKTNLVRISKMIADLENETKTLIEQIQANKGVKLSFREKGDFRKTKEKANKNLEYLYLVRDFFTALAKNASGLILKNEELMLVTKFAPYFDGVPVLDVDDDEDSDDSVLGAFKEVGEQFKEVGSELLGSLGFKPGKQKTSSASQESERVSKKCVSCSAPLVGNRGQVVKCKYCDTEQIL